MPSSAPRHHLPGQSTTRSLLQLHPSFHPPFTIFRTYSFYCPLLWLMRVRSICLPLWSTLAAPAVLVGFRPVVGFGAARLRDRHGIRIAHSGRTRCGVHRCYASRSTTPVRAGPRNERRISCIAAREQEGTEWHAHYSSVSSFRRIPVLSSRRCALGFRTAWCPQSLVPL